MAQFEADVKLDLLTGPAERQLKKIERNIDKIEDASRDILRVDKLIVAERRKLQTLSGDQALRQKKRVADLRLQRTELSLQKKELQGIVSLEKRRQKRFQQLITPDAAGGGAVGAVTAASSLGDVAASRQVAASNKKVAESIETVLTKTTKLVGLGQQQVVLAKELIGAEEQVFAIRDKVEKQQAKIATKQELIAKASAGEKVGRSVKQLEGDLKTLLTTLDRYEAELSGAQTGQKVFADQLNKTTDELNRINSSFNKVEKSSKRVSASVGGLRKLLLGLGISFGAIELIRFTTDSFRVAASLESQQIRLKALSAGLDDYQEVLSTAQVGQELFNQSQLEATSQFARAYSRLRPLGLTLKQVQAIYEGFNVAALNSGTTSAEAAGAFTQLTQALGSGTLRGEELNSILEQTPAIAQSIATELGITIGQLKDYGKEGRISSETVLRALVRVRNEGVNKLSKALDSPQQKFKDFANAAEDFKVALADEALPAVTEAVKKLATIIRALEGPIRGIGQIANSVLGDVIDLINAATKPGEYAAAQSIKGGRLPLDVQATENLFRGTGPKGRGLEGLRQQSLELARLRGQNARDILLQLMQDRLQTMEGRRTIEPLNVNTNLPFVQDTTEDTTLGGDIDIDKFVRAGMEAGRIADEKLRAVDAQDQLVERLRAQVQVEGQVTEAARLEKQLALDLLEIRQDISNRMAEAYGNPALQQGLREEAKLRTELAQMEFARPFFDAGFAMGEGLAGAERELTQFEQAVESAALRMGTALEDALVSTVEAAVTGAKDLGETLQQIAADLLGDVGRMFIKAGINSLGAQFNLPGFADGGQLPATGLSVVGERGPELAMSENGRTTIIPMDQAMGRYNLSNAATNATISSGDSVGVAAGGGRPSAPVEVNYNVTEINGMRFVTEEQFRVGLAKTGKQAAEAGEARAMQRLRMSPSTRRKLGL